MDDLLADLFEDVHWVLLIGGNVLSLDVDGETALIPPEVMQHSIGQAASVDLAKSMEVLASPGKPVTDIPGFESSDHLIRLLGDVFRLAEVTEQCFNMTKLLNIIDIVFRYYLVYIHDHQVLFP